MQRIPYRLYVLQECKRQWGECQEEKYGPWEAQSEEWQREYFEDMYNHLWNERLELDLVIVPDEKEESAWNKLKGEAK